MNFDNLRAKGEQIKKDIIFHALQDGCTVNNLFDSKTGKVQYTRIIYNNRIIAYLRGEARIKLYFMPASLPETSKIEYESKPEYRWGRTHGIYSIEGLTEDVKTIISYGKRYSSELKKAKNS